MDGDDYLFFNSMKSFVDNQRDILKTDKLTLHYQKRLHFEVPSTSNGLQSTAPISDNSMVVVKPAGCIPHNVGEKEKETSLKIFSEAKVRDFCRNKATSPSTFQIDNFTSYNEREKEKDRLAAIFASSSYTFPDPTNYDICKNLNSRTTIHQYDQCSDDTLPENQTNKLPKFTIPEISIFQHNDSSANNNTMEWIEQPLINENQRIILEFKNDVYTCPSPNNCINEKEIKEYLYRQELQKQIEEKNILKAELKRKEAEEEAKLEEKIMRDQEKIRRQYEQEKKEQEKNANLVLFSEKPKSLPNVCKAYVKMIQSETDKNLLNTPYLSAKTAPGAINHVHGALEQSQSKLSRHHSNTIRVPSLAQPEDKILFDSSKINCSQNISNDSQTRNYSGGSKRFNDVNNMLTRPLIPNNLQEFPPISVPLPYATIPPINDFLNASIGLPTSQSLSPRRHAYKRNSELLEEKWKVPYEKSENIIPADIFTKHNGSVLTQLGAFRRHLQQERLRMQERIQDDSP